MTPDESQRFAWGRSVAQTPGKKRQIVALRRGASPHSHTTSDFKGASVSSTFLSLHDHVVFSTMNREALIAP